ncbi:MAG TPA: hypothetical protein DCS66_21845 [Flavobacteriaceae bacterium]|nr:hypothetical protein [Legionellales bacterium]MAZ40187.1 hypothetical protein [Legionellales bacterium]HAT67203.1 hypothetical protein [Flavobacteriaceae bacterium]|tara:strand:+ start:3402 stop:4586 length:1185 start_codon:yes stop_codon:yes gene_type:complete
MKKQSVAILILFLMVLAQLATDLYLPSFPAISSALNVNLSSVQLTFSVFLAGFAISQLIYGPLCDRYGRKPFLIIGVILYFLMAILSAFSTSITLLLISRAIQGIGAGACSVIPRAIMRDCFSGRELEKITIYQSIVWSFVPISAPLLGSYVQHYLGWEYNFILLAIISLLALIMCLFFRESIAEKENRLHVSYAVKQYLSIIKNRKFYSPLLCAVCIISFLTAFNVSAPIIIQKTIGLSTIQYGWSVFIVAIAFMVASIINRFLSSWIETKKIVISGFILISISVLLMFVSLLFSHLTIYLFLVPIVLIQMGSAFIFPSNAAKAMQIFPDKAGKAAAIFGSSIFLGGTIVSFIMSILPEYNLLSLAVVYSIMLFAMAIFYRMQFLIQPTGEKL